MTILLATVLSALQMQAQVVIRGNVYGGGNEGRVSGSTEVVVTDGDLSGSVFGGARSADVGGSTLVNIDGEHACNDIIINSVYGGNDVSGTIGTAEQLPAVLTNTADNGIDNTWNSFVHTSQEASGRHIYIGQLYGGGNMANLGKTYLELCGGTFGYVYGGGNEATVTLQTDIFIDNASTVTTGLAALTTERLSSMGLNMTTFTDEHQFIHVFGGNNKAEMSIRPTWHLKKGDIHDLYSGGNKGDMTSANGITLNIDSPDMTVLNVYGGCRNADVAPTAGVEYSAVVNITDGRIANVYGGNDISGTVHRGTRVNILSSILGDVYGGGNGSYVYTDNTELSTDARYGDFYYDKGEKSSAAALLDHRPNVENTMVYLCGSEQKPTYIHGSVFCGGNSATLRTTDGSLEAAKAALRIGSYVVADKVFLGSNGANMVDTTVLATYAGSYAEQDINSMDLTESADFEEYMKGVEVAIRPNVSFNSDYVPYSSKIGSFYCGGNVGSMSASGMFTIDFLNSLVIYNKLVGGCNQAHVEAGTHNAAHEGGLIVEAHPKVQMNLSGLKLQPRRLTIDTDGNPQLEWNTTGEGEDKRLHGANIYGGCYESGYVNGDVEINLYATTVERDYVFGDENSGVILAEQGDDVFGEALNIFGGGYGTRSVIRGNTTVNMEDGYSFQLFGGGEKGIVTGNTTVNLNGGEVEYLYGGGFVGPILGHVTVNLGDGTCYDTFAGSCNADIDGYTEVFIGRNGRGELAYPYVRDNVYGGNDFGGRILGKGQHKGHDGVTVESNTYVEYLQGRVDSIFGGNYGYYEYADRYYEQYTDEAGNPKEGFYKPFAENSFVFFRPSYNVENLVGIVFGGSQGHPGETTNNNSMQLSSYVLVDDPHPSTCFYLTDIYGAGAFGGLGLPDYPGAGTATIDLYSGRFHNVYGASNKEGITGYALVNVPAASTVQLNAVYGGGQGYNATDFCDAYVTCVDYHSSQATVEEGLYGGNENYRISRDTYLNIDVPVRNRSGQLVDVFGAGLGTNTLAGRTHVYLNSGAEVKNVFGGGSEGMTYNMYSMRQWLYNQWIERAVAEGKTGDDITAMAEQGIADNVMHCNHFKAWLDENDGAVELPSPLPEFVDDFMENSDSHNTNVFIHEGATVAVNAYGGGLGAYSNVNGTTCIQLLGGSVAGNLYGGGYGGPVENLFPDFKERFEVGTYVDIVGGSVTNVYGGGYEGNVGHHDTSTTDTQDDITGDTHVVIGVSGDDSHTTGNPTIERSLYGGGQRGAVFGTAYLTMNNGYVGYTYTDGNYVENLDLQTDGDNLLYENGNAFGGGYDEGGTVDSTVVILRGGSVRNSLYGGGEIAAIGRGSVTASGEQNSVRVYNGTYKAGKTHVEMLGGHVCRDIFGGGRGYSYNLKGSEISGKEFYTDGYVFGQTEVYIYYGEVGTAGGLSKGYGNVFGGGNIGYVYGVGTKTAENTGSPGHYYYKKDGLLTEDCRVVVQPVSYVLTGKPSVTIDGVTYSEGDLVPNEALNALDTKETDSRWNSLDISGINIRNAVFGGGNVSSGSDKIYANAVTVFGNVTASLRDVYHRDLITIGTEHTGGLYGGGNLSLVEGYRELNITNYGTDYYNFENNKEITIEQYYNDLNDRERAYFQLLYKCVTPNNGYSVDQQINEETYQKLDEQYRNTTYWLQAGFCTIYAGRLLNTLQRSDFCGVFGSRMVLQGARDRVTTTVDYTDYTINRIGELSLNQNQDHGNYFGIYSVVNHLGNLTSDIHFSNERITDSNSYEANTSGETYQAFKTYNINNRKRNNGTSKNKVALASGVFLELTTENSSGTAVEEKDWGYITGIIELDLINVVPGEGGGYVYAKNQHGASTYHPDAVNVTLSSYNSIAETYKRYTYADSQSQDMQTSGNFVHNVKTEPIIDDCYPSNGNHAAPAHYWFIKGEIYVYEQTISAYTGSATAYAESVRIPLNITAASNGRLKLINVQPNLYAYYATDDQSSVIDGEMKINGVTYHLNDTITYWDYSLLSESNKRRFVPETWVCLKDGTVDGVSYTRGQVVLPLTTTPTTVKDKNGDDCELTDILRTSNNLSHSNGYLLTFDMNNPMPWDDWYAPVLRADGEKINTKTYSDLTDSEKDKYIEGPTFRLDAYSVHGQRDYKVGDIIPADVVSNYLAIPASAMPSTQQATVVPAYISTEELDYVIAGRTYHAEKGADISETDYLLLDAATQAKFTEAFVCTSTVTIDEATNNFIIYGTLLSQSEIDTYKAAYASTNGFTPLETDQLFSEHIVKAYRCTEAGKYGGKYYEEPKNYSAIESWCSLPDRDGFTFNKDAFDILYDDSFGTDFQADVTAYGTPYSDVMAVDYTAYYTGETDATAHNGVTLTKDTEYSREDYESLPNERYHYSPITATKNSGTKDYYVVTQSFYSGDMAYIAGQVLTEEVYTRLRGQHGSEMSVIELTNNSDVDEVYYYCREDYVIGEKGDGEALTIGGNTYNVGSTVPKGTVINASTYSDIVNHQQHFVIRGTEPTETSTLYVSRESDIKSLSKDRTYTVIYQYTYDEGDDTGSHIDQISELHVVNIHVKFRSGVPTIGDLSAPPVILPGTTIGLTKPSVTEGAYEIMEGGWEMYRTSDDAGLHRNGKPFVPSETQMYWYQNQKYHVAYYAKTYLGKTYSNQVPVTVANYHDISDVMQDKEHHMYIDHTDVMRDPKIYIDQTKHEGENQLEVLKSFFDLTTVSADDLTPSEGHAPLNTTQVGNGRNLELILRSDLSAPGGSPAWTPIGSEDHCFEGTLHGDGYTISNLDHSLFSHLCGDVYNLGVTGSFTTAGIADTGDGYMENCWIMSSQSPAANTKAVFGNPTRDSGTQLVNCYYPLLTSNSTQLDPYASGLATPKPEQAFHNGEVAYNLNGFYLKNRYDRHHTSGDAINDPYVQSRYSDGDFIYANGVIPQSADVRQWTDNLQNVQYSPIWPDDYLFFGQMLTYGYVRRCPYEELPAHLVKDADNSYQLYTTDLSNRVYRAPAYYRSAVMGPAHFNPYAILAQQTQSSDTSVGTPLPVYPGMTAIDFTGCNDVSKGYKNGLSDGVFYPPLLDDDGLTGIVNQDETQNLLVYSPEAGDTYDVLSDYFVDPVYTEGNYRTVAANTRPVKGHLVLATGDGFTAANDHLLVDKQEFNAPLAYTFAGDKRIWYQRQPDNYVDIDKGWETVSLPFTAQLVTTQEKGELTHFYQGSTEGHEYWLREYRDMTASDDNDSRKAVFNYPDATVGGSTYSASSTFLWDYYYGKNERADANGDLYQQYYSEPRDYAGYPLLQRATPYLIGFPGPIYSEFDLSGQWTAEHTALPTPGRLSRQVVTFASAPGVDVGVSDDEMAGITHEGYSFIPNYLVTEPDAVTNGYALQADGSRFQRSEEPQTVLPFRAYFTAAVGARTRSIVFSNEPYSQQGESEPDKTDIAEVLNVYAWNGWVVVQSSLRTEATVRIVNTGGLTIASFTVYPGETIKTPVGSAGVYIVRTDDGRYTKKVAVK